MTRCGPVVTAPGDIKALSPNQIEKKIQGSWLIYKVGTKEASEKQLEPLLDTLTRLKNRFELTALTILPHQLFLEDSLGRQQKRTWKLLPPDMIGMQEEDLVWEIVGLSDSILTLSVRVDYKKKHTDALLACYRVNADQYEGVDLGHASLNQWRQPPQGPETRTQVAARVASLLRYDGVYLQALSNSSSDYFDTRKFHLPFSYYNGGIGLKAFDPSSAFAALFYNAGDAETAYSLLKEYLNTRPYPNEKNYMLAYAGFMKNLAEVIELNVGKDVHDAGVKK
ncbi:hypothetical protein LL912_09795 [Niabella sp. CC-SYL272]|uniref:hypothetical protein n=1 Tax=Niabella agricola TaxID=2891571 RepID=UPI001F47E3B9|nr:hypothetical protein [Niabella agricola]MCF3109069.1 hypothetical protein [Niabella agricola]